MRTIRIAAALVLLSSLASTTATATAQEDPSLALRVNAFVAPTHQDGGPEMPVYLGYSMNTATEGPTGILARDAVSNTAAVPRSEWGGEGADEWGPSLGVLAGTLSPYPGDDYADPFYLWSGMSEGQTVAEGDDIAHIKMWFTSLDTYQVPHTPTGKEGSLAWRTDPSWPTVVRGTTVSHPRTVVDGEVVASPVPQRFTRAMYLNHAELSAQDGDVDAAAGDVLAPSFTFSQPVPEGTVMNLQVIGYVNAGPWGGHTDVAADFTAGTASGVDGSWDLPVQFTLEQGGFMPERAQAPGVAAPQNAFPITAMGIPLLPEELGAAANETHLVSDLQPGETFEGLMGIRQPDGSVRTEPLTIDEPGLRLWRIEDGRLVEEHPLGIPGFDARGAGAGAASAGAPTTTTSAAQQTLVESAEGRPVAVDVARDGVPILESYDVPRIHTPGGTRTLGAGNRDGRASVWMAPDGSWGRGAAAYRTDDVLVIVHLYADGSRLRSWIESHSLTGDPVPHEIETVGALAEDAPLVDLLSGPVTRATTFLPGELSRRFVVRTEENEFRMEPLISAGTRVSVRNRGAEPRGEPLHEPELVITVTREPVWQAIVGYPLVLESPEDHTPEPAGAFTAVRTYRVTPPVGRSGPLQGGDPIEETRDFDGYEPLAVAFQAEGPDGSPISVSQVDELYLALTTLDGTQLFAGTITAPWSTEDGAVWGAFLTPNGELDPAQISIYARATTDAGLVTMESSPEVPNDEWRLWIDRLPLEITGTADGEVTGRTQPLAAVTAYIPELGVGGLTLAALDGTFLVRIPLPSEDRSGDYDLLVRSVSTIPEDPEATVSRPPVPPGPGFAVPDDGVGSVTLRYRHLPGGADPSIHRPGPPIDRAAAAGFLASREQGGAYDNSIRATAWAVEALGAETPAATSGYLASLAAPGGYGWHAQEEAAPMASALAARAIAAVGGDPVVDPTVMLRTDGGAQATSLADATTVEATAGLVLALDAAGDLGSADPWWVWRMRNYLEDAEPTAPMEAFARHEALVALGAAPSDTIAGADLDAVAARVLTTGGDPDDLAPFQIAGSGFSLRPDGDLPEAYPTALALAASG